MVMVIPPAYAVSEVMGKIKCWTAGEMRRKFEWLKKVYWRREDVIWSPGYFVSTIGLDEASILAYVKWQERQDSGQMKFEF